VNARESLDKQIDLYEANFVLRCSHSEIVSRYVEYFPEENGIGALVHYVFVTNAAQKVEISLT